MQTLLQDLKYGWRILQRNPGFATVAVLTLAIGIGANAAIFSVVHTVLLRPLPYADANRLVIIWDTDANRKLARGIVSPAEFLDWRDMNHVFDSLAGMRPSYVTLTGEGVPEQTLGVHTAGNLFRLLGLRPILGRDFLPEEEKPGHEQVAMLSYAIWQRRYGGDIGVIGRSIVIDYKPYTVIGVLPRDFSLFGTSAAFDVWVPFAFDRAQLNREDHELVVFGRLKEGVQLAGAQAEMEAIIAALKKQYPQVDQKNGILVEGFQTYLTHNIRPALLVFFAAVVFVLLIACANVPI